MQFKQQTKWNILMHIPYVKNFKFSKLKKKLKKINLKLKVK